MRISGDRVRCANCGMIYEQPPAEQVFHIGVPFTIGGTEFCPSCGSNAADPVWHGKYEVMDNSSWPCQNGTLFTWQDEGMIGD